MWGQADRRSFPACFELVCVFGDCEGRSWQVWQGPDILLMEMMALLSHQCHTGSLGVHQRLCRNENKTQKGEKDCKKDVFHVWSGRPIGLSVVRSDIHVITYALGRMMRALQLRRLQRSWDTWRQPHSVGLFIWSLSIPAFIMLDEGLLLNNAAGTHLLKYEKQICCGAEFQHFSWNISVLFQF